MPVVSKTTVRLYPPDDAIIDAWAAANPDPDTGEPPPSDHNRQDDSIGQFVRSTPLLSDEDAPASRRQLMGALASTLEHLDPH